MKKLLISVLCIMMMCFSVNVKAENDINPQDLFVENNEVSYTDEFEMDFEIDGLTYYPFVYRADNVWFIENVIGPTNCQEGYLYVKNLDTGRIIQLLSQPVDVFYENSEGLYFIYANNVFFVTYDGQSIEKIYSSNGIINNNILELRGNDLYFCEDNKIVKYNTVTENKTTIARASNVTMLYIKSDNEIVYEENNNIHYIDGRSGARSINRIITDEYEYNNLFVSETEEVDEVSPMAASKPLDTNLSPIANAYPSGSYFSTSGTKCTHHGNCNYYGGCGCISYGRSIQCMAYARWAFDKYANLTSWDDHAESENGTYVRLSSDADVISFFSKYNVGAYVRLTRATYNDGGFHSAFYARKTSTTILTYECNLYGGCEISFVSRTPNAYRNFCKGFVNYMSHNFGLSSAYNTSYNSTYHIQRCMNSGCPAYRYEQHYALTTSSNVNTCTACGYVGTITYREALD